MRIFFFADVSGGRGGGGPAGAPVGAWGLAGGAPPQPAITSASAPWRRFLRLHFIAPHSRAAWPARQSQGGQFPCAIVATASTGLPARKSRSSPGCLRE